MGKNEDECVEKAISHLKRGTFDAFKLKLKYYHNDLDKFEKKKIDLTLIDNGEFYKKYSLLKSEIRSLAKTARLEEKKVDSNGGVSEAFTNWMKVSNNIATMENDFFNSPKINWAKVKTIRIFCIQTIVAFILGVLSGCAGNYVFAKLFSLSSQSSQSPVPIPKK